MRQDAVVEPRKIIVATHDVVFPLRGGGALRTLKAAKHFTAMGHDVVMLVPSEKNEDCGFVCRVKTLKAPTKQRSQILSAIKFNVRLLGLFFKFCPKSDCVFVHNTIAAVFLPFLKKLFGFGFFLDITDIHAEYLLFGKRSCFEKLLTPFLLKYEYWIIKSADALTVATARMKRLLVEKGISPDRIKVVFDGVDAERFSAEKNPCAPGTLIHLGAVDRQHGVELGIEALCLLQKKYPHIKLCVVGSGRELEGVVSLAGQKGVEGMCEFSGSIKFDQAPVYLRKASIGLVLRPDVLPNTIVTTLKIFDYWASGTAVVAPRLDGICEIARHGENALLFEAGNAVELAACIGQLLDDAELRQKLVRNGLESAAQYRFDDSARQICEFALKYTQGHEPE